MEFFSEDDIDIRHMAPEELTTAWWLWFTLAQNTNDSDPPYSHGVFTNLTWEDIAEMVGGEAMLELRYPARRKKSC